MERVVTAPGFDTLWSGPSSPVGDGGVESVNLQEKGVVPVGGIDRVHLRVGHVPHQLLLQVVRVQHIAGDAHDHRLVCEGREDVVVGAPARGYVVGVQRQRELNVTVGVEAAGELFPLVPQVVLDVVEGEGRDRGGVLVRTHRDLVLRARSPPNVSSGEVSVESFVDGSGRAIGQHGGHPRRGQASFGRIARIVVPAVPSLARHDREPLDLAYADGPVRVPAASRDEAKGVHVFRIGGAPLQRQHAPHAAPYRHLEALHAQVVQQHPLQSDVIAYGAR